MAAESRCFTVFVFNHPSGVLRSKMFDAMPTGPSQYSIIIYNVGYASLCIAPEFDQRAYGLTKDTSRSVLGLTQKERTLERLFLAGRWGIYIKLFGCISNKQWNESCLSGAPSSPNPTVIDGP